MTNCLVRQEAVTRAMQIRKDVQSFKATFPGPCQEEPRAAILPAFSWEQLERQLSDLASTRTKASMAGPLVSATRKQAAFKPPEMVLREILCIASSLMDETFEPSLGGDSPGTA